jgi:hypothetical protein
MIISQEFDEFAAIVLIAEILVLALYGVVNLVK